MTFKPQIELIDFDIRGYKNELDKYMRETTAEAAKSWLRTVLVIIPTWSRASRATFEALANEVGFNVTYGPVLSKEDRLLLGLQTSRGGVEFRKGAATYKFFYETDLRYLAYNNLNRVVFGVAPNVFSRSGLTNPTPYKFTEAGQNDFKSFANNFVKLPNPYNFVTGKKI